MTFGSNPQNPLASHPRPEIPDKDESAIIPQRYNMEDQAVEAFPKDTSKVGEHHTEGEFTLASLVAVISLSEVRP